MKTPRNTAKPTRRANPAEEFSFAEALHRFPQQYEQPMPPTSPHIIESLRKRFEA